MTGLNSTAETDSFVRPEKTNHVGEYAGQKYHDPGDDWQGYPSTNTLDAAVTVT